MYLGGGHRDRDTLLCFPQVLMTLTTEDDEDDDGRSTAAKDEEARTLPHSYVVFVRGICVCGICVVCVWYVCGM